MVKTLRMFGSIYMVIFDIFGVATAILLQL